MSAASGGGGQQRKRSWGRSSTLPSQILKDYIVTIGEGTAAAESLLHSHSQYEHGKARSCDLADWYHWNRFQVHLLLEEPRSSSAAFWVSALMLSLVLMSLASFVIESLPSLNPDAHPDLIFYWFCIDLTFNSCFSLEYSLRFWSTSAKNITFVAEPMNIVDVLSVVPFWIQAMPFLNGGGNGQVLRIFRLVRIFRVFKLARFSVHLRVIVESFLWALDPLILLAVFVSFGVFLFSVMMWFLERGDWDAEWYCFVRYDADAGRTECSPFQSIPESMYWGVTTMTTVGYGDAIPLTPLGRCMSCMAMIFGILVIAMPVSVLSTTFQQCFDTVQDQFKLEKVEDMLSADMSEEGADAERLQCLCMKVRSSKDQLLELMPEIRALVRKRSAVDHRNQRGQDMTVGMCNLIETTVTGQLSLLSEVLEQYAIELLDEQQHDSHDS
jgi:hypothetical protein